MIEKNKQMVSYRKSSYLINIKLQENRNLFLHGYTGAIDLVSSNLSDYLEQNEEFNIEMFPSAEKIFKNLLRRGYITDKTENEEFTYVARFGNLLHQAHKKLYKCFSFLITYNCNFRCPYCFENEISCNGKAWSSQVFNKEMVDRAYQAMMEIEPKRELHTNQILLYGGEPLLKENKDIVSYIVKRGRELGYTFFAITNGYDLEVYQDLLSPELIASLQITLDGCKDYHNSRRKHFTDIETFDRIIKNIGLALSCQVKVSVRINTDINNFQDIAKLNELFKSLKYAENPNFYFYSSVLRYYNTSKDETNINYLTRKQLVEKHYAEDEISCQDFGLYEKILNCLQTHTSLNMTSVSCAAQYGSFLFDPKGDIYSCLEVVGKKEHVIGHFGTYPVEWTFAKQFWVNRNIANAPNCNHCKYALLCGGGCLGHASFSKKGFGKSKCPNYSSILQKAAKKAYQAYLQNI